MRSLFSIDIYSFASFIDSELMQNLKPVGGGPSGKTCPRCASHVLHMTSTRIMPSEVSFLYLMAFGEMGSVKLGQPDLLSYLILASNKGVSQHIQWYFPGSCAWQY